MHTTLKCLSFVNLTIQAWLSLFCGNIRSSYNKLLPLIFLPFPQNWTCGSNSRPCCTDSFFQQWNHFLLLNHFDPSFDKLFLLNLRFSLCISLFRLYFEVPMLDAECTLLTELRKCTYLIEVEYVINEQLVVAGLYRKEVLSDCRPFYKRVSHVASKDSPLLFWAFRKLDASFLTDLSCRLWAPFPNSIPFLRNRFSVLAIHFIYLLMVL